MTFSCDQGQVNWQLIGHENVTECKKRKKSLFIRIPGWEEGGNGAVRVWEEYFDKPLRVKEETLKGHISTDGAEPAF